MGVRIGAKIGEIVEDTNPLAIHGQRCHRIHVRVQMQQKATTDLSQLSAIEHSDRSPLNAICRVAIGPGATLAMGSRLNSRQMRVGWWEAYGMARPLRIDLAGAW